MESKHLDVWIDDSDLFYPLNYTGPWTKVDGEQNSHFFENGKVFLSTLHELRAEGSFAYPFDGSSGRVVGTYIPSSGGDDRLVMPKWICALDGVPIYQPPIDSSMPANNWVFCDWNALPGIHLLTFNITYDDTSNPDRVQPFLLDYVAYQPTAGVYPLNAAAYRTSDVDMYFDNSWVTDTTPVERKRTQSGGSMMTFTFYGIGIEALGSVLVNEGRNWTQATATYRIDNADPVSFNVPYADDTEYHFWQLFEATDLEMASHTVIITYSGNRTTAPLAIERMVVHPERELPYDDWFGPIETPPPISVILGVALGALTAVLMLGFVLVRVLRKRYDAQAAEAARLRLGDAEDSDSTPINDPSPSTREHSTRPILSLPTLTSEPEDVFHLFPSPSTARIRSDTHPQSEGQGQPIPSVPVSPGLPSPTSPTYISVGGSSNPFVGTSIAGFSVDQPPLYSPT